MPDIVAITLLLLYTSASWWKATGDKAAANGAPCFQKHYVNTVTTFSHLRMINLMMMIKQSIATIPFKRLLFVTCIILCFLTHPWTPVGSHTKAVPALRSCQGHIMVAADKNRITKVSKFHHWESHCLQYICPCCFCSCKWDFWPTGGVRWKVRRAPESFVFILL